jgi:hypothetical protein
MVSPAIALLIFKLFFKTISHHNQIFQIMVSLPLVSGGWVDIDPRQVASIRALEDAGLILNGKCVVTLRGGVTYEIHHSAKTVKEKCKR